MAALVDSVRICFQGSCKKRLCCIIRCSGHAGIGCNAKGIQAGDNGRPGSAADDGLRPAGCKEIDEGPVAGTFRIYDFRKDDLAIFSVIELEILRPAEMLPDFAV